MTDRCVHLASDKAAAQERLAPRDKVGVKPMRVPRSRRSQWDLTFLQRKLGHAGLQVTSRFVHLSAEHVAAIERCVAPIDKIDI